MGIYVSKYKGKEIDDKLDKVGVSTSGKYTITVPASNWKATGTSGTNSYYSNTVAVDGVTEDSESSCFDLADDYKDNANATNACRQWTYLDTADNSVTFYSADKITADFAIRATEVK